MIHINLHYIGLYKFVSYITLILWITSNVFSIQTERVEIGNNSIHDGQVTITRDNHGNMLLKDLSITNGIRLRDIITTLPQQTDPGIPAYALDADKVDGFHANIAPLPNTIAVYNSQAKLLGSSIFGPVDSANDSSKLGQKVPTSVSMPNAIPVLNSEGKIPADMLPTSNPEYIVNMLDNPDFVYWQRGSSFEMSDTVGGAYPDPSRKKYLADRWMWTRSSNPDCKMKISNKEPSVESLKNINVSGFLTIEGIKRSEPQDYYPHNATIFQLVQPERYRHLVGTNTPLTFAINHASSGNTFLQNYDIDLFILGFDGSNITVIAQDSFTITSHQEWRRLAIVAYHVNYTFKRIIVGVRINATTQNSNIISHHLTGATLLEGDYLGGINQSTTLDTSKVPTPKYSAVLDIANCQRFFETGYFGINFVTFYTSIYSYNFVQPIRFAQPKASESYELTIELAHGSGTFYSITSTNNYGRDATALSNNLPKSTIFNAWVMMFFRVYNGSVETAWQWKATCSEW